MVAVKNEFCTTHGLLGPNSNPPDCQGPLRIAIVIQRHLPGAQHNSFSVAENDLKSKTHERRLRQDVIPILKILSC